MRRSHRRGAFWLTVAGVSILAQLGFNIVSDKVNIPGLSHLNDYVTRRS